MDDIEPEGAEDWRLSADPSPSLLGNESSIKGNLDHHLYVYHMSSLIQYLEYSLS